MTELNESGRTSTPGARAPKVIELSTVVELLGVLLVVVAAFAVDWRLGLAVVGGAAVIAGYLLDDDTPDGHEVPE